MLSPLYECVFIAGFTIIANNCSLLFTYSPVDSVFLKQNAEILVNIDLLTQFLKISIFNC